MEKFERIYVCNYTPLKDRRENMIEQCKKYGIDDKLILVNKYDRENIPPSVLQSFDTNKLKMAEISLFLKHMYCMGGIIQSGKPYGIIMEDDVVFKDDFVNNFNRIVETVPSNFDILHVGVFLFKEKAVEEGKAGPNGDPVPKNATRIGTFRDMSNVAVWPWMGNNKGTDFYIISLQGCIKFMQLFNFFKNRKLKINLPIDWYMGQMLVRNQASVWWCDEEITIHGSKDVDGHESRFATAILNRDV